MSQGRTPISANSTIRRLTMSGNGRPFTNTPPSWLTPAWPETSAKKLTSKRIRNQKIRTLKNCVFFWRSILLLRDAKHSKRIWFMCRALFLDAYEIQHFNFILRAFLHIWIALDSFERYFKWQNNRSINHSFDSWQPNNVTNSFASFLASLSNQKALTLNVTMCDRWKMCCSKRLFRIKNNKNLTKFQLSGNIMATHFVRSHSIVLIV